MYYGLYEEQEVRLVRRFVRSGDTVLDIGANIGFYTILLAGIVGESGQVHAFEPLPANFLRLRTAVSSNHLNNVRLNRMALGSTNGVMQLYENISHSKETSAMASRFAIWGSEANAVETMNLDTYVTQNNLTQLDFIKIDIEGGEWEAFQGMEDTLSRLKPRAILAEVWSPQAHLHYRSDHEKDTNFPAVDEICRYVKRFGYDVKLVNCRASSDGVENMLFVRTPN